MLGEKLRADPSEAHYVLARLPVSIYVTTNSDDLLADALGLVDRVPLRFSDAKATQFKLITFVPPEHVDKVASALFDAGAGRIGNYTQCSFRSPGTGICRTRSSRASSPDTTPWAKRTTRS